MVNNSRPGAVPSLESSSSQEVMVQGEGGSCVNTHTGTVRVAASQGNIVLYESEGESSSVNTHTGSVRVAASLSNIISEESSSMKPKYGGVRKHEPIACLSGVCQECVKCTNTDVKLSKCDIQHVKKKTHTFAKPSVSSKENCNPPLSSTLRLREYFQQFSANTKFVGKGGRGDLTPIKRKLANSGCVKTRVKSFDVAADSLPGPGESDSGESPAKRQRCTLGSNTSPANRVIFVKPRKMD